MDEDAIITAIVTRDIGSMFSLPVTYWITYARFPAQQQDGAMSRPPRPSATLTCSGVNGTPTLPYTGSVEYHCRWRRARGQELSRRRAPLRGVRSAQSQSSPVPNRRAVPDKPPSPREWPRCDRNAPLRTLLRCPP